MRVTIRVRPNSKKGPFIEKSEDCLIVYVREPALEGRANKAVIKLLSEHFKVAKSNISITKGQSGRHKFVDIAE